MITIKEGSLLKKQHLLRLSYVLAISLLFSSASIGQIQDFGSWWSIDVSKDISKDLKAGIEFSQRFSGNSLQYDKSLATLGLEYEIIKNLSIQGGFRYVVVRDDYLNLGSRYRIQGDISYDYKFDRLSLKVRERIQYGFDDVGSIDYSYFNKLTNRTKFTADYNIFGSPFSLGASYEIFVDLNDPYGTKLSGHRFQTGANMALTGKSDIELKYMFDKEVNTRNPLSLNAILLTFSYDL